MLFRGMRQAADGFPETDANGRTLGVRPGDIPIDPQGMVRPGTDGMSVAPDDPMSLPEWRRPPELGGTANHPVFQIPQSSLGPDLQYRADPANPTAHGFVEPSRAMTFDQYQGALWATRKRWSRVNP